MGKYKKHILYSLYLAAFCAMVYVAYTSSKYRPESVSILFTDLSWLGNWPKWLDLPLMPYLTVERDDNGAPLVDPANANAYSVKTISSDTGRLLPTIGLILEI